MSRHDTTFVPTALRRHRSTVMSPSRPASPPRSPLVLRQEPQKHGGRSYFRKIVLWTSGLLLVILVLYLCLIYANDRKSREKRNQRYNLGNYVDYAKTVSKDLPRGHIMEASEKKKVPKRVRGLPRFRYDEDEVHMPQI